MRSKDFCSFKFIDFKIFGLLDSCTIAQNASLMPVLSAACRGLLRFMIIHCTRSGLIFIIPKESGRVTISVVKMKEIPSTAIFANLICASAV